MPIVPRDQREAYRQWAKDNHKSQMDEHAWVNESHWQDFLLRPQSNSDMFAELGLGLAGKE
jgi:hypothetical protein